MSPNPQVTVKEIVLGKLLLINIWKNTISWYDSCLAKRQLPVKIPDKVSKFTNISRVVPKG